MFKFYLLPLLKKQLSIQELFSLVLVKYFYQHSVTFSTAPRDMVIKNSELELIQIGNSITV